MKVFKCQVCNQTLFFENRLCEQCKHSLGYDPASQNLLAVTPAAGDSFTPARGRGNFRFCENATHDSCNWLIPAASAEKFCTACRHNRTIPDLPTHLGAWQRMEFAKHRLFYTLIALRLPLVNLADDPERGLAFDFLADAPGHGPKILTGHDEGLITINLNEADDALREKLRTEMGEPYRTLLGHFRHEVGHYFWNVLVRDANKLDSCRAIFGDDSADYGEALKRHYAQGAPADWAENFISAYATAHPWEDFAETWAHYLHIVDTLETASTFGLRIHPASTKNRALHANIDFDPYSTPTIQPLIDAWLPLTFAVNALNRSMGHADLYPFVVAPAVVQKLAFIHDIVRAAARPAERRGIFGRKRASGTPIPPPLPPNVPPQQDPTTPAPPVELPPANPENMPPPGPVEIPPPVRAA
jgi:hypothetical protein